MVGSAAISETTIDELALDVFIAIKNNRFVAKSLITDRYELYCGSLRLPWALEVSIQDDTNRPHEYECTDPLPDWNRKSKPSGCRFPKSKTPHV